MEYKHDDDELTDVRYAVQVEETLSRYICWCLKDLEKDFEELKVGVTVFKLKNSVEKWNEKAKESREIGNKSLMDFLERLEDQSGDEETQVINEVKAVAVHLGIELSEILIDYFFLFELNEMMGLIGFVKNMIQPLRVEESSIIVVEMVTSVFK
ncbi:hypothetical protein PanWU01x14_062240 [Parasponia andersonii]|uniref:Uncharacterized protein n=1 Tax=Parasponia andersonii TaxID=3476 RepID=A0A2P5DHM7_PARAD|nr:hypothetical protein PanWU01x14_062240 [Parasponia andersonii]